MGSPAEEEDVTVRVASASAWASAWASARAWAWALTACRFSFTKKPSCTVI